MNWGIREMYQRRTQGLKKLKKTLELDIRNNLLESGEIKIVNNVDKCPNIYVRIQSVKTEALIDTGNEITCTFKNSFANKKKFQNFANSRHKRSRRNGRKTCEIEASIICGLK